MQTLRQATEAALCGARIIVAQGGEAGGHGGLRGTMALVPAVVDAVSPLPVVAAGGIGDGRGLAAALMLGAVGVLCGTAFYACEESLAHPQAKRRLVQANGDDTVKGPLFDLVRGLAWPEGPWALRTLRNRYAERWAQDLDGVRDNLARQQARFALARQSGNLDIAPVIAGEAVDFVRCSAPAGAVLRAMVSDCATLLARACVPAPMSFS